MFAAILMGSHTASPLGPALDTMHRQLSIPREPHALVEDLFHQRRRRVAGHEDAPRIQAQVERQLQQAAADAGGELHVEMGGGWAFGVRDTRETNHA